MALLRDRAGDYTRAMLGENSGAEETQLALLSEAPAARCSPDLCLVEVVAGARRWRVLATRSGYLVPWREMIAACGVADVVVSERRLPPGCRPRWLKLDRDTLTKTGGVAIRFGDADIRTVRGEGKHPWFDPLTVQPPYAARQGDRQMLRAAGAAMDRARFRGGGGDLRRTTLTQKGLVTN